MAACVAPVDEIGCSSQVRFHSGCINWTQGAQCLIAVPGAISRLSASRVYWSLSLLTATLSSPAGQSSRMLSIVLAGSAFAPQLTPPQLHTAGRAAVFASAEGAERKFARAPNLLDLGDEKVTSRQIVNVLGRWTTHTQWWEGIGVSVNLEAILNDPSKMAELNPYVAGYLVTFVENEGRLGGTRLDRVPELVECAKGRALTIAGGVTTAEELSALDRQGVDA